LKKTTFLKLLGDKFNKILNKFGYSAIFSFKSSGNPEYEVVNTPPIYAPWNVDKEFKELYKTIENHTLVDKYRCYELWQLIEQVKDIPGALIEIGVWRGGSGALIAKKALLCGIKENVYLCDTFEGIVKTDKTKDSLYQNGAHSDTSVKIVEKLVYDKMKLENIKILKGIFPEETKHMLQDNKFRFCHIDVDVYQSSRDIVDWIWDKISAGGIIVYDDYANELTVGMKKIVEEERKRKDCIIIYNLNGHAIEIKIS